MGPRALHAPGHRVRARNPDATFGAVIVDDSGQPFAEGLNECVALFEALVRRMARG